MIETYTIIQGDVFMEDWRDRPRLIEYWPDGVDYVMGMDESGTSDLVSISRMINSGREFEIDLSMKDFTLTGVILDTQRYELLKKKGNEVKFKFWENGVCDYKGTTKRVCFHSRDIRKRNHPFNKINAQEFLNSISEWISGINAKVISCYVDKLAHYKKYSTPLHPYHIAAQFILERYCKGLNDGNKKGIVIIESRGAKEDKFVLDYLVKIINEGTNQNPAAHFKNIVGIYFNPKWWKQDNEQSSFIILEYADLVCYPIHKQHRLLKNEATVDPAYSIVEKKLFKYPNHMGWGLKIWRP